MAVRAPRRVDVVSTEGEARYGVALGVEDPDVTISSVGDRQRDPLAVRGQAWMLVRSGGDPERLLPARGIDPLHRHLGGRLVPLR